MQCSSASVPDPLPDPGPDPAPELPEPPPVVVTGNPPVSQAASVSGDGLNVISATVADDDSDADTLHFKIDETTFGIAAATAATEFLVSYTATEQTSGSAFAGELTVTDGVQADTTGAVLYNGLYRVGNYANLAAFLADLDNSTTTVAGSTLTYDDGTHSYLFVSDSLAGLGVNDVLIQLNAVTGLSVGATIVGGDITAFA